MPNIGSLTVELDLQTQKYEAGLKRSKQQIDQHSTSLNALQQDAIDAGRTMTSASDEIVAAWGKSGDAAQNAIRKMEQLSQKSAVNTGIREMKDATDGIVESWGKVGDAATEASHKIESSAADAGRSLKGIEQMLGIHIPKALDHVLAESQMLGPVLAGALTGIAALQFLEILGRIYEMVNKVIDAMTKWSDESKKAFKDQTDHLDDLMHKLNAYAALLDKTKGVGLAGAPAAIQDERDALNEIARTQASINQLELKSRNIKAEIAKIEADIEEQLRAQTEAVPILSQKKQLDALNSQLATLEASLNSWKDLREKAVMELPLITKRANQAVEDENKKATDKAAEEAKRRQDLINNIIRQNQHSLLQQEQEINSRQSAYIGVLSNQYEKQLDDRSKGLKQQEDEQKKAEETIADIIRRNQAASLKYEEEIHKQESANIGLITKKWELENAERDKALEAADKLRKQNQEASRALQSSLTRDFGQFLEHSTQEGADFWRSFERFGLNALDAIKNYSDKIGGAGGLLGGLASVAPFAPIAVGALEFGRGIGQKVGQGRNEADVFGANVLKPFQDQVGAIMDLLQKSANAGTLTTEALTQAQTNFEQGWQNVLDAAAKTQTDVGKQAVATLTPIVSKWREAIGGFADDAMAADQATAALSAQLQALADQQKSITDETTSLIDKILNPAGNLTAMEGALQNLTGVNKGQIIQAIGDDLLRIGDALSAASRPIPPMINELYQYAKAQEAAVSAQEAATEAAAQAQQASMEAAQALADETQSIIDKVINPAGNLTALEGALSALSGTDKTQIIAGIGDDIKRVGDALAAAGQPIPELIYELYQFMRAQETAAKTQAESEEALAKATERIVSINDELTGVYDDLGHALNRQLDRLDNEKASLEKQIADAQNSAVRQQLEDTIANTSDLGEYIRAQARLRDFDQQAKQDQAKADIEEVKRMQDRLNEVTQIQDATSDIMQKIGAARISENDLVDQSIGELLDRASALEQERAGLAEVTNAAEMATNTFLGLSQLLYQFNAVPSLKSYAHGTDFVPATGPYVLHRGESVIPAGQGGSSGGMHLNFYGPVVGDMNELADRISGRVLENNRYDVQYSGQRQATRQRASRSNRW